MKDLFGCNRDHSKELDLYNLTYTHKVERVNQLRQEGNDSYKLKNYDKASYYYAQALLTFYYLIPETPSEEIETQALKRLCHRN